MGFMRMVKVIFRSKNGHRMTSNLKPAHRSGEVGLFAFVAVHIVLLDDVGFALGVRVFGDQLNAPAFGLAQQQRSADAQRLGRLLGGDAHG